MTAGEAHGLRILHLADDPLDTERVRAGLAVTGIDPAAIGRVDNVEALNRALDMRGIELILSDQPVRGFGGSDAIAIARKRRPDIPIIVVTPEPDVKAAIGALDAGAADCVTKDDTARLAVAVTRALRDVAARAEQRQAEDKLAWLAAIVQSTGDAVTSVTLDRIVTSWNRGAERTYGYTAAEMIGRPIIGTIPPHRADEARAIVARVRAGQVVENLETERLRKDGTIIPVSVTVSPIHDRQGALVGIAAIARDITRRRQAEAAARHSERRFRDFAETASDWFWETGPTHRFTYISDRAADHGGEPARLLHLQRWAFAADWELEPEKWRTHVALLERRERFRDFVYKLVAADGSLRHVAVAGKPVLDDEGRFAGYRGVARDVTAAVESEAALREAKRQAENANRAKSDFLANMSHELRTPLNAIMGFSDIIKSNVLGLAGISRYRAYAEDIHASARHLLGIINDILDVAKIEAGHVEISEQPHRLQDISAEIMRLMAGDIDRAGLAPAMALDPGVPPVMVDARAVRQMLLNLVSNAVKFTRRGGTVTIGLSRTASDEVRLSVQDSGIGIAGEDIPKLMQPFTQLGSVYGRNHQGTGLGLALVRALAERHGGTVTIESALGQGTTVTVTFPAQRVAASEMPPVTTSDVC